MVRPKDRPLPPPGKEVPVSPEDTPSQKHKDLRAQRTKHIKAVKVCPKCNGYMLPVAHFGRDGETHSQTRDNAHRSFGGVEIRTFECEKCHFTGQFQVDPFPKDIDEGSAI